MTAGNLFFTPAQKKFCSGSKKSAGFGLDAQSE
jgi:hypothetical protein